RPERLAEVELAVRALPHQKTAQALFAGGADDQVRVGLALGVQMLGDLLHGDRLAQFLQRPAGVHVFVDQRAHSPGDLVPPAIADGDIDVQSLYPTGVRLGGVEPFGGGLGQEVHVPHQLQVPTARASELLHGAGDDLQQIGHFLISTAQVVCVEHTQRIPFYTYLYEPHEPL